MIMKSLRLFSQFVNLSNQLTSSLLSVILLACVVLSASGQTVPAPDTRRPYRFGVYNWNVDDTSYPSGNTDRLNWAADKVATLGTHTIRVYLGPDYASYKLSFPSPINLVQAISGYPDTGYDKLFKDSRFSTYLLTVYTQNDDADAWGDGFSDAEYNAERDEIAALGTYLLQTYANKTFIILNWEGDNAIGRVNHRAAAWDNLVRWTNSRADGVRQARTQAPSSSSQIYSGLEFNLTKRNDSDNPNDGTLYDCGTAVTN